MYIQQEVSDQEKYLLTAGSYTSYHHLRIPYYFQCLVKMLIVYLQNHLSHFLYSHPPAETKKMSINCTLLLF